jgi:Flp pilus assembly protein TadD
MKYSGTIFKHAWLAGLLLLVWTFEANAQRTGTWLDSKAIPSVVETWVNSDEIDAIRDLLEQGRKTEALAAAEKHVAEVELTSLKNETSPRYYAYNALCTVLTSIGKAQEAVDACTTAMQLEPTRWSAVNNRGTAWLVMNNPATALADYQLALLLAPDGNAGIISTIEHNISLAQQRAAVAGPVSRP